MAQKIILVVEDEHDIRELISYTLEKEGYLVLSAADGLSGLEKAKERGPDLILLDIMLPDLDGLEVCRRIRKDEGTESIPVIMLTAKAEDTDVVTGLELGADDYIAKPFSPRVLIARIRSVLRRKGQAGEVSADTVIRAGTLELDAKRHRVLNRGREVELSATEFAILKHLISHPGWVFSRGQIIDAVKGGDYPVTERSVDVQILGVRKKLGQEGRLIETVRGVGYRLKADEDG